MPEIINSPTVITAAGNKPKLIEEFIGLINSNTNDVSIAKMTSPGGWLEPGQTPEFDEYTIVLKGMLRIETKNENFDVKAGQAIVTKKGEWVRYSTPDVDGAEYVSICVPAFSSVTVHRDEV